MTTKQISVSEFKAHCAEELRAVEIEDRSLQITEGFRDFSKGRSFEGTCDFEKDMKRLDEREAEGWK